MCSRGDDRDDFLDVCEHCVLSGHCLIGGPIAHLGILARSSHPNTIDACSATRAVSTIAVLSFISRITHTSSRHVHHPRSELDEPGQRNPTDISMWATIYHIRGLP